MMAKLKGVEVVVAHAGVIVLGIEGQQIAWGRLYMEVIEWDSADIHQMVRDTYRPPGTE